MGKSEKSGSSICEKLPVFKCAWCTLFKTTAHKGWATATTGTPKFEICREVLPRQHFLMTSRNLCSLELPDYPNSTKSEICLPTMIMIFCLTLKLKLQGHLLWIVLDFKHSISMGTHFSVGLRVSVVEIPLQEITQQVAAYFYVNMRHK